MLTGRVLLKLMLFIFWCLLSNSMYIQLSAFLQPTINTSLWLLLLVYTTFSRCLQLFFFSFLNCWSLFIVCSDHMQCPILCIPLVNGSVFASGISIFVQFISIQFFLSLLLQFSGGVRGGGGRI